MVDWDAKDDALYAVIGWDVRLADSAGDLSALNANGLGELEFEVYGIPSANSQRSTGAGGPPAGIDYFYPRPRGLLRDPIWFLVRLLVILPVNIVVIALQLSIRFFKRTVRASSEANEWLYLGRGRFRWWEKILSFDSSLFRTTWSGIPAATIVELGYRGDGIYVNSMEGRLLVQSEWNELLFTVLAHVAPSARVILPLAIPLSFIEHCQQNNRSTSHFGGSSRAIVWS